jgi:hypothetical protein
VNRFGVRLVFPSLVLAMLVDFAVPASPSDPSTLPEIGRTRTRVLCTVLREVVAKAVLHEIHADQLFADARRMLFKYTMTKNPGEKTLERVRVGRIVTAIAVDVADLKRAMDDPRFAVADSDAAAVGDRAALDDVRRSLKALYGSQLFQLNAVGGKLEAEELADLQSDFAGLDKIEQAVPPPTAFASTFAALPRLRALPLADAHELDNWLGDIAASTTQREETAAKLLTSAASACR